MRMSPESRKVTQLVAGDHGGGGGQVEDVVFAAGGGDGHGFQLEHRRGRGLLGDCGSGADAGQEAGRRGAGGAQTRKKFHLK